MNGFVLILMLVCGEPTAMAGWGIPAGIGPFFGTMQFIERDEEVNVAVQVLLNNPSTEKVQFEFIPEEEKKYKCGTGA